MKIEITEKGLELQFEYLSDVIDQIRLLANAGKPFYVRKVVYNDYSYWEIIIDNSKGEVV